MPCVPCQERGKECTYGEKRIMKMGKDRASIPIQARSPSPTIRTASNSTSNAMGIDCDTDSTSTSDRQNTASETRVTLSNEDATIGLTGAQMILDAETVTTTSDERSTSERRLASMPASTDAQQHDAQAIGFDDSLSPVANSVTFAPWQGQAITPSDPYNSQVCANCLGPLGMPQTLAYGAIWVPHTTHFPFTMSPQMAISSWTGNHYFGGFEDIWGNQWHP